MRNVMPFVSTVMLLPQLYWSDFSETPQPFESQTLASSSAFARNADLSFDSTAAFPRLWSSRASEPNPPTEANPSEVRLKFSFSRFSSLV